MREHTIGAQREVESPSKFEVYKKIALTSEIARNGLLKPEHVAYCMAWRDEVNPDSRPISVLYGGMGADVSTVFLTTDAEVVIGVDYEEINRERLEGFLEDYDQIDSYLGQHRLEKKHGLPWTYKGKSENEIFEEDMRLRSERGFYEVGVFERWSAERLLFVELKKMGVDKDSLSLGSDPSGIFLEFVWSYPSIPITPPRKRRVYFRTSYIHDIMELDNIPVLDCYYQKSAILAGVPTEMLRNLVQKKMNPFATVLVGTSFADNVPKDRRQLVREFKGVFAEGQVEPLRIPMDFTKAMIGLNRDLPNESESLISNYAYGWHLTGARMKT